MPPDRPRLLVLTPRYPYPVVGGDRLRIYYLCKALAQHYSLTLLSLCESQQEMRAPPPEDGVFERIHKVHLPRWRSMLNTLLALPTSTPLQVAYYRSPAFRARLHALLPEHQGCVAHLIRTGDYLRGLKHPLRMLEMTDAISLNYQRLREVGASRGVKARVYRVEASRLQRYEQRAIREFDLVTLVSDTDRAFLLGEAHPPHVVICSNGVDLRHFPFSERRETAPVIAYIGNMTSYQNMDAALHFIEDVLPLLRRHLDLRFRVVGKITAEDARTLRGHEGVEVTGPVDDVARAVADARMAVCPVRVGAGVQNKVLEYLALGLPAISSSVGLEGFHLRTGVEVLCADTPEQYLEHVRRLWTDANERAAMARAGRAYVETHHDWAACLRPMTEQLLRLHQTQS